MKPNTEDMDVGFVKNFRQAELSMSFNSV